MGRRGSAWVVVAGVWLGASGPVEARAGAEKAVLDARDAARLAFQDARFGLFVSWGVSTLLGKGEWVMERDRLPVSEYEKLPPRFNPAEFDPEAWAKTASAAGAKYLTVTAKAHDGFCLFDTKLTRYDVVDATPYARDPLKGLADACRKHGLALHFAYSLLDWHHPDYAPRGLTGQAAGRDDRGDWSRYVAYYQGQVRELCTQYGPIGGIRFEGAWDRPDAAWDLGTTVALIRELQPGALVGIDVPAGAGAGVDYRAPARELPPGLDPRPAEPDPGQPWEVCRPLGGSWGYRAAEKEKDYASAGALTRELASAASRGGNLLVGVAPKADGTVPAGAAERLAEVGRWLSAYGGSVYGTRAGPFPRQTWGVSTVERGEGRPGSIYLHVFEPVREVRLPPVAFSFDARLFGTGRFLTQAQDGQDVVVTLPEPDPSRADTVVVLTPQDLGNETPARRKTPR